MSWFESHRSRLDKAVEANQVRGHWSPYQESPSRRHHPTGARKAGEDWFQEQLGSSFELEQPAEAGRTGAETDPYTGEPLGIDYPKVDPDALLFAASVAGEEWARQSPEARVGVCMEILHRLEHHVFHNTYATMHTAGQPFMTAFAGSGANSLDRGLEAVARAWSAMSAVPAEADFERAFGGEVVKLKKRYRLVPRGVAVVISCGSYPAWNAYPALLANLATGNSVVLKPHPNGILPMALVVRIARQVLTDADVDPNVVTLAADTRDEPVAKELLLHPETRIIDYTGSQQFGAWIEQNCADKLVYTETAGTNAVVLESADNLDAVLQAVAHGICLFSSQMCTAPQNIWVPHTGVQVRGQRISVDEIAAGLAGAIDDLVSDPEQAAGLLGAIHTEKTMADLDALASSGREVVRRSASYDHPTFPEARTATPMVVRTEAGDEGVRQEHFGPMAFVIGALDRDEALELAARDAGEIGAIATYLYSEDEDFIARAEDLFSQAGASVGINLIGSRPINYTAAFSDFHVSGLNPAGTACLTDLAFVADRFRVVQSKREV